MERKGNTFRSAEEVGLIQALHVAPRFPSRRPACRPRLLRPSWVFSLALACLVTSSSLLEAQLPITRAGGSLRLGQEVSAPSLNVRVPLFLARTPADVNYLQVTLAFDSDQLSFKEAVDRRVWGDTSEPGGWELRWPAERIGAGMLELVLLRGAGAAEDDEEVKILEFAFNVRDTNYPNRYKTSAYVSFAPYPTGGDRDPTLQTFLAVQSAEGRLLEQYVPSLSDGEVTIYLESGVEVGSGSLTRRPQNFVVPLFLTHLESVETVSIGIDYDELILLSKVEPVSPMRSQTLEFEIPPEPPAGLQTKSFTLEIAKEEGQYPFRGPFLRTHVANLVFYFVGSTVTEEFQIVPRLLATTAQGEGAGTAKSHSVPGVIGFLDPHFVRGNVDSSVSENRALVTVEGTNLAVSGIAPELSDVVLLLEGLFLRGFRSDFCLEAADVDNNGFIDLGDAVQLLQFLYQGGEPPASPFPLPGTDPDPRDDVEKAGVPRWGCDNPLPIFKPSGGC